MIALPWSKFSLPKTEDAMAGAAAPGLCLLPFTLPAPAPPLPSTSATGQSANPQSVYRQSRRNNRNTVRLSLYYPSWSGVERVFLNAGTWSVCPHLSGPGFPSDQAWQISLVERVSPFQNILASFVRGERRTAWRKAAPAAVVAALSASTIPTE